MPAAVELEHMRSWQVPTAEVTAMVLAVVAAAGGAASSHALAWGITSFRVATRKRGFYQPCYSCQPPTKHMRKPILPTSVLPRGSVKSRRPRSIVPRRAAHLPVAVQQHDERPSGNLEAPLLWPSPSLRASM